MLQPAHSHSRLSSFACPLCHRCCLLRLISQDDEVRPATLTQDKTYGLHTNDAHRRGFRSGHSQSGLTKFTHTSAYTLDYSTSFQKGSQLQQKCAHTIMLRSIQQ